MLKAVMDFEYACIRVRKGEAVEKYPFEPFQVQALLENGLIAEIKPGDEKVQPIKKKAGHKPARS